MVGCALVTYETGRSPARRCETACTRCTFASKQIRGRDLLVSGGRRTTLYSDRAIEPARPLLGGLSISGSHVQEHRWARWIGRQAGS